MIQDPEKKYEFFGSELISRTAIFKQTIKHAHVISFILSSKKVIHSVEISILGRRKLPVI